MTTDGYSPCHSTPDLFAVDQGVVHHHPVTFNPDDDRFYVHTPGTTDGTNVLGRFKDFRNAVQYARRRAEKTLPGALSDFVSSLRK